MGGHQHQTMWNLLGHVYNGFRWRPVLWHQDRIVSNAHPLDFGQLRCGFSPGSHQSSMRRFHGGLSEAHTNNLWHIFQEAFSNIENTPGPPKSLFT